MRKILFYATLSALVLYWVFLRYYELGFSSFWIDEWYSSIISYFMMQNHLLPQLWNGVYEFSQYFFHIFQVMSFQIFWISDFSARIPSLIFSGAQIFIFYLFSQELLKKSQYKNIGILFLMCLFLFSTWQIIWSREARFYEMLSFLYFTTSFFLYKYIEYERRKYFAWMLVFLFIGILFHPFFLWLTALSGIFLFINWIKKHQYINFLIFLVVIWSAFFIDFLSKYFLEWSYFFQQVNTVKEYYFSTFFVFYQQILYWELGIILLFAFFWILYFFLKKEWKKFVFFSAIIAGNLFVLSFWYFAHSRYIFHIFSLITLLWGYMIIIFFETALKYISQKNRKIFLGISLLLWVFGLFFTYNFTFLPQKFYYIDYTSPKPNFKNTYEYIKQNNPNTKIISGFPHMCYWYNRENTDVCEYALKVNLIGSHAFEQEMKQKNVENYTNVAYIDDFSQIDTSKYLFVMDDLTLKNTINKAFIREIITQCDMIYKDVWDYDSANFIWIWKCQ